MAYYVKVLPLASLAAYSLGASCILSAAEAQKLAPISVYGNVTVLEIAPVLLAADRFYPGNAVVRMGGIPNLFGDAPIPGFGSPGVADVATHAETQALRYSVKHPDLRIIMTVSEGLYRIIARRSQGISQISDLRGKRIATIPSTSAGYFVHQMLASAGMSEADVTIVRIMPLSDMATALLERRVDAVAIWEPEIERAALAIGDDAVQLSGKDVYREVFGLNTTAANLADPEKRRQIVAFVRSVIKASEAVRKDPADAQVLFAKYSTLDIDRVRQSWAHQTYPALLVDDLLDVLEQEEQWLAVQDRRVPRTRSELAPLIDASVLAEAQAL